MSSIRIEKVSELLLNFLGQEIRLLKDPRLDLLTVTDVNVTPDLKRAHVFWSKVSQAEGALSYPDEKEIKAIDGALEKASGRLRSGAGKALGLRYTPKFIFSYDKTLKSASRIDELLAKVKDSESSE